MDSKNKLLKDLGFSNEFIKEIENNSFENNANAPDSLFEYFSTSNYNELDLTSLIVEKTEDQLNENNVFVS